MAPPTPFKLDFDQEIKKNVVEVRGQKTGEVLKFTFNDEKKRFEAAKKPEPIHRRDLEPLYQTKCERFSRLIFCKQRKQGKIFKYCIDESSGSWRRVQCVCCAYNKDQQIDEGWLAAIKKQMIPDNLVIEDKYNFRWFQPQFSKFCENTDKITVYALIHPNQHQLLAYNFDIETEEFVRSECRKPCCKELIAQAIAPKPFDFGAQGIHYKRTHRDEAGRSLICLAINWYNKEHGQMEIFMDSDGDIGRYEWNERLQCFNHLETLNIHCLGQTEDIKTKGTPVWYDDGLRLLFTRECKTINDIVYFCWHLKDSKTRQYRFNPASLQFSMISCSCCDGFRPSSTENFSVKYSSCATGTDVVISRTCDGGLLKVVAAVVGRNVAMKPSPIRFETHLAPFELKMRREKEQETPKLTQLFTVNDVEGWVIRPMHPSSDGCSSIGTLALMDGSVKPFSLDCERRDFSISHSECADLRQMEKNKKSKKPKYVNTQRYTLDWDLEPQSYYYCSHDTRMHIVAFNHFTGKNGIFVFDEVSEHVSEIGKCRTCSKTEWGTALPEVVYQCTLTHRMVFLWTNEEGRIVKMGTNPGVTHYSAMPPKKVFTSQDSALLEFNSTDDNYAEQLVSFKREHEQWKKEMESNMLDYEKEIENYEKEKKQSEKMIAELKMKFSSLQEEFKKVEEEKRALENVSNLNDIDLTPTYRNYCKHTGHFIITALNNLDKTTNNYIFNPVSGYFHQQDYCKQCPPIEQGVKIKQFVTIMPVERSDCKFPYLVMTNDDGRLVRIAFDPKSKQFLSMPATKIQIAVRDIRDIKSCIGNREILVTPPMNGGFSDAEFVPQYRYYCSHIQDFLIQGYHNQRKCDGVYMFNSKTGHLEERNFCAPCRTISTEYKIEKMRSIMPVMSPYSQWPVMLTTDKNGRFCPIAFDVQSTRFIEVPPLKVVLLNDKKVEEQIQKAPKTSEEPKPHSTFRFVDPFARPSEESSEVSKGKNEERPVDVPSSQQSETVEQTISVVEASTEQCPEKDDAPEKSEKTFTTKIMIPFKIVKVSTETPKASEPRAPETPEESDEEYSDEEEWCCSDEECDCSDEECSDEEDECDCSDDDCECDCDCSDDDCDCDDEECSDEEDEESEDEESEDEKDDEANDELCDDKYVDIWGKHENVDNLKRVIDFITGVSTAQTDAKTVVQSLETAREKSRDRYADRVKIIMQHNQMMLEKRRLAAASANDRDEVESTATAIEDDLKEEEETSEVSSEIDEISSVVPEANISVSSSRGEYDDSDEVEESIEDDQDDVEPSATEDREDAESTATAIEDDQDDVESTATAIEDDLDDVESTATAIENSDDSDIEIVSIDVLSDVSSLDESEESEDSEDSEESEESEESEDDDEEEEMEDDARSTTTAVEPSDDESDVSHVDAEPDVSDVSDSESADPESDDTADDISIISSTSTAREFSIAHDSGDSMGSDISYLESDLGSTSDDEEAQYEDAEDSEEVQEPEEEAEEPEEAPVVSSNPCTIS
uniref:Uncharacterized protein n=1 Tax=Caenorhabditis tropicalis TaxID=1561998 RepID=A0A1I7UYJ8_9PELO